MRLRNLLPADHVLAPIEADTLRQALALLVRRLSQAGAIARTEEVERILGDMRLQDVVAIDEHIVLPHCRISAVDRLVVGLGVAPAPLDAREYGLQIRPELIVLILAPPEAATRYLQTVSALSRVLRRPDVAARLRQARSVQDVLAIDELQDLTVQPQLTVRDIMLHHPRSISPDTPVREAVDLLVRQRLRAIPVVGGKHEVLGMITEWDIMKAMLPQIPRVTDEDPGVDTPKPADLRVRDIMARSVLCISEDMGLNEVANMMINKDVENFPVVSEGKLTGLISRGDIIRKLFAR